ncbi:hypothetical protein EYC84_008373 [Monilinia fructicola]|uniref:Uncharacterized protein n=1 Tax=Monilinia fructicola TaxID=38448 RepID=A0A5M9JJM2_MONFR|nr:hypothetical protein EYC84_008373 [Monilinia fructicola]
MNRLDLILEYVVPYPTLPACYVMFTFRITTRAVEALIISKPHPFSFAFAFAFSSSSASLSSSFPQISILEV